MCRKTSKGFTLVELIIVIAIIIVLSCVIITHSDVGKRLQEKIDERNFMTACLMHDPNYICKDRWDRRQVKP